MRRVIFGFFLITLFYSCVGVERVDVSNIQDELALSKPLIISDGEILSVAQMIGDSLTQNISHAEDTSYVIGYNHLHIIGKSNEMLKDVHVKTLFDAYNYTFEEGRSVKSNVSKKDQKIVHYHSAYLTEQNEMKMVLVDVSIKDITLKIASEREK